MSIETVWVALFPYGGQIVFWIALSMIYTGVLVYHLGAWVRNGGITLFHNTRFWLYLTLPPLAAWCMYYIVATEPLD
jgi:hypothetical protein